MGSRPRRYLRLCAPGREALAHPERRPDCHRSHLDPLVLDHQAQELPVRFPSSILSSPFVFDPTNKPTSSHYNNYYHHQYHLLRPSPGPYLSLLPLPNTTALLPFTQPRTNVSCFLTVSPPSTSSSASSVSFKFPVSSCGNNPKRTRPSPPLLRRSRKTSRRRLRRSSRPKLSKRNEIDRLTTSH